MKKKINLCKFIIAFCGMLCWWGVLYPELTLTSDTYKVVYEDDKWEKETIEELQWDQDGMKEFLSAKPEQIRIRSKLYMRLKELLERKR